MQFEQRDFAVAAVERVAAVDGSEELPELVAVHAGGGGGEGIVAVAAVDGRAVAIGA